MMIDFFGEKKADTRMMSDLIIGYFLLRVHQQNNKTTAAVSIPD